MLNTPPRPKAWPWRKVCTNYWRPFAIAGEEERINKDIKKGWAPIASPAWSPAWSASWRPIERAGSSSFQVKGPGDREARTSHGPGELELSGRRQISQPQVIEGTSALETKTLVPALVLDVDERRKREGSVEMRTHLTLAQIRAIKNWPPKGT